MKSEKLTLVLTELGSLTLFRSIVQSSCYPIAAYLAVRYNRAHVIALGAFLWAAATFFVALSSTFFQAAVSRALNGIGLAIVAPAFQSLVADCTDDGNRGVAFGWLQLTANFGSAIGGLLSVLIAPITFLGIPGWRISFHIVGLISVVFGILVRLFASDPHYSDGGRKASSLAVKFQIIVAQGVMGSFPWSALSFAPMWLELLGFSHEKTAALMALFLFVIASSLGGLFGGRMGDFLSRRLPNSGRIILSQISSASAIPLAAILLLVLPNDPSKVALFGLGLFILGFCISWNAPATNNPIFAEIVPEKSRASVYALGRSLESILSSFAPPVVGYNNPLHKGSSEPEEIATDRGNAASLAKALYTAVGLPMALCCLIYSFLYSTYPRDRERARMEALIESEMQEILTNQLPEGGEYSQSQLSKTEESYIRDRSVIEVEYESDDDHDTEENDENAFLYRQLKFSNLGE
ncbi:hypothetical protein SLA2020_115460 [Shorea laevis]